MRKCENNESKIKKKGNFQQQQKENKTM